MSPDSIIAATASVTGVSVAAIAGRGRRASITQARFLAIAAVRAAWPAWSLNDLGAVFGRDHSTIIYAIRQHSILYHYCPSYQSMTATLLPDTAPPQPVPDIPAQSRVPSSLPVPLTPADIRAAHNHAVAKLAAVRREEAAATFIDDRRRLAAVRLAWTMQVQTRRAQLEALPS